MASSKRAALTLRQQQARIGLLLLAPSVIIILGVVLQPILTTFYLSFFEASLAKPAEREFVGLGNYLELLGDSTFWATIWRTLYFTVVSVGIELVLGMAIALLIHAKPYGWQFLRASLIIPWAIPTIVNGTLWRWIYNADYGALNGLLLQFGLIKKYIPWLIDPWRAMNLVIIADVWHSVPFIALIIQAALATLPAELDEAAAVDGANAWQRFWRIRLPLLRSAILVALVIRTVEAFRVFDILYVITQGGPAFGTVTISVSDLPANLQLWQHRSRFGAILSDFALHAGDGALLHPHVIPAAGGNGMSRRTRHRLLLTLLVVPVLIGIYAPIAWLAISSISTRAELLIVPPHWIPQHPTFQNYLDILLPGGRASEVSRTFAITLRNSLVVASAVTVISLVVGSLAAYALARLAVPYRSWFFMGILGTRMIPEISLVIPLYILAARFNLLNTPTVLVITYLCFTLPFAIWLMAAFFESVPFELEDAARIDGCTPLGILFRIVLPISTPGLVSTALFTFLLAWDEFFFALLFTSTVSAKTVPVAISEFAGRYVVDISAMMTGGMLAAIPPVLLALVFQRYIVSGLTAGAVKGG